MSRKAALAGMIFDKDGTLFQFQDTWAEWAAQALEDFSGGDVNRQERMAHRIDFDLAARAFRPGSICIAGTNGEVAEALAPEMPGRDAGWIERQLSRISETAPLAPAAPLKPLLTHLSRHPLTLGVVTNDSESAAQAQLTAAGVLEDFAFVAGFDSGHGFKPDPDPLLAFCTHSDLDPDHVAMVGDSLHDLIAGRGAGMTTVGVLTGLATRDELAPMADVVLPDIGHLPGWLSQR